MGIAGAQAYRWLAGALLLLLLLLLLLGLLHLGRRLWLLVQALAALAAVGLLRAAHAAVIIERVEAAGGRRARALLVPHARGGAHALAGAL